MPSCANGTPSSPPISPPAFAPWNEADAIRETALIYVDEPEDKETLRRLGRLIFNLAVETTAMPFPESMTHAELRAAAADLRHLEGFLDSVRLSADDAGLPTEEEDLATFAGLMARRVGGVVRAIEGRLAS